MNLEQVMNQHEKLVVKVRKKFAEKGYLTFAMDGSQFDVIALKCSYEGDVGAWLIKAIAPKSDKRVVLGQDVSPDDLSSILYTAEELEGALVGIVAFFDGEPMFLGKGELKELQTKSQIDKERMMRL